MNIKKTLILILIVTTFLVYSFLKINIFNAGKPHLQTQGSNPLSPSEYKVVRDKYVNLLTTQDPRIALDKLSEEIKVNNSLMRSCHSLVHELGYQAYQKYGDFAKSLRYQNEICNSGFFHGVIEAYFSNSDNILEKLKTVCAGQKGFFAWQCNHGVGHGVMYYTLNDLYQSVDLCEKLDGNFAKSACINGVFMENFNTDQKLHPSKFLREDNPFYPCFEQKDTYKADCYLYAPTYYLQLNKNNYIQALKWCKSAEGQYQSTCALGVGSQMIKENINDPKFAENICLNADKDQRIFCIQGMVGLYINHYGSLDPAKKLCNIMEASNKKICTQVIESRSDLL